MTTPNLGGPTATHAEDQALETVTTSGDGSKPLKIIIKALGGRPHPTSPQRPSRAAPDPDPRPRRRWLPDVAAVSSFVLLAFWVTARLWRHPTHGLADNRPDQAFFEWMFAHGARVVTTFTYPFVSKQMNVPDGVNMMANTSVLGISLPLSPITLLFGPHVAFKVFLTGGLIATAVSWYFVLSRFIVRSRTAAWLGALFCGFAPSMVSHANGHPNIVSQFLVPVIIWRTLRLREPGRWLRNGLLLALVIVWQAFINLEILLLTAVGLGIFLGTLVLFRRDLRHDFRTFVAGLAVTAAVTGVLLAYPIYVQFFGPQAYHGLPPDIRAYGADAASFVAFSRESLAGSRASAAGLAQNPTEENAFFGWPLVILIGAIVLRLRRTPAVIALAVVGMVFAVLSLGPEIRFAGDKTGIPSVWRLMVNVPVLNSAVPTRWALAIASVVGLLLALAWERSRILAQRNPNVSGEIRFGTAAAFAMALVPIAPTPLPSVQLPKTPQFITAGTWKQYVGEGETVTTLPLPANSYPDPLRWSAQTGLEMPIPRGYFLGPRHNPKKPHDRTASFAAPSRPTASLFGSIYRSGRLPTITPTHRAQAREDLRHWRSAVVILAPQKHESLHRSAMTDLVGMQPQQLGGVWVWDVRALVR